MQKVLVVDDDESIRELLAALLMSEGFEVLTARDAQAALEMLKHESDALVVLLDWLMPQDGPVVLAWLDTAQRFHHKVVVMSASMFEREWEHLLAQGKIAAYLPKPFEMDDLLALLQRLAA